MEYQDSTILILRFRPRRRSNDMRWDPRLLAMRLVRCLLHPRRETPLLMIGSPRLGPNGPDARSNPIRDSETTPKVKKGMTCHSHGASKRVTRKADGYMATFPQHYSRLPRLIQLSKKKLETMVQITTICSTRRRQQLDVSTYN